MKEYHKIQSLFKRDMESKEKKLIVGEWTLPEFEYLQHNEWVWTEKVDGTNIRVMWDGLQVAFAGRTDRAQIPPLLLQHLQQKFPAILMESCFEGTPVCLYGEGYGKKIQKVGARYIPDATSFILFDINIDGWWLSRADAASIAFDLGVAIVPLCGEGTLNEAIEVVRGGFPSQCASDETLQAEGLVVRPAVEMFSRKGHRIISKIKTRDF